MENLHTDFSAFGMNRIGDELCRIGARGEELGMRAAVADARERVLVVEQVLQHLGAGIGGLGVEHRAQPVGDRDVEHAVDGMLAGRIGDVLQRMVLPHRRFARLRPEHDHVLDRTGSGEHASVSVCGNISPYLIAGPDLILPSRTEPRPGMPEMNKGSQPTDGGHLLLTREERTALLAAEPAAKKYLRRFMGGDELINGGERWCLWLKNADPSELRECPQVMARVAAVRDARLKSPTRSVRDAANTPSLFTQDRQPSAPYLAVPEVSSENRRYIPMGFLTPEIVASNKLQIIVGGTLYHFGVLISAMHMAWVRVVAGRLESRLSYAPSVYNNYPWAAPLAAKERAAIEASAQAVLDARADYPASTLADLYDPLSMPASLAKAHAALDRAVDRAYATAAGIKGSDVFPTNRARVEHLFALYEKLTAPLLPTSKPRRGRRASKKETTASPSSDADTESEPEAEAKSNLPDWYRAAFKPYGAELMRGELKANSLETIYDRIDDMVDAKAFGECDALLKVVTDEINTSPLDALVGLLTGTIWVAKHLPHRPKLREKTGERLRAAGKDAEKVLQGL